MWYAVCGMLFGVCCLGYEICCLMYAVCCLGYAVSVCMTLWHQLRAPPAVRPLRNPRFPIKVVVGPSTHPPPTATCSAPRRPHKHVSMHAYRTYLTCTSSRSTLKMSHQHAARARPASNRARAAARTDPRRAAAVITSTSIVVRPLDIRDVRNAVMGEMCFNACVSHLLDMH